MRNGYYLKFIKVLCSFLVVGIFVSCVGTVEDKNPETTKASPAKTSPMSFVGIDRVIPIANDKAEVYFLAAAGPNAKNVTYIINYDGLAEPLTVSGTFLRTRHDNGLLMHTVSGLTAATQYTFEVQAKNETTGEISSSTESRTATTFSNITSDFDGISSVENLPGSLGTTNLRINWPEAYKGNPIFPVDKDVIEYTVVLATDIGYLDTNRLPPERFEVPVSGDVISYVAGGLAGGTKYYVRVRATHRGVQTGDNSSNPNYKREENNKYVEASTLSNDPPVFNANERTLEKASGAAAKSSLNITWGQVSGTFDHFRVYYAPVSLAQIQNFDYVENECSPNTPYGSNNAYCRKLDFTENATTLTDLIPYKNYYAKVIVCRSATCNDPILDPVPLGFSPISQSMAPNVAGFGGITNIAPARDSAGIDQIFLQFDAPITDTGILDGLVVKVFANGDDVSQNYFLNIPDLNNDDVFDNDDFADYPLSEIQAGVAGTVSALRQTPFEVLEFDYTKDLEIAVSGFNPLDVKTYSFLVAPYIVSPDGEAYIYEGDSTPEEFSPAIVTPNAEEFVGVDELSCDSTQSITVKWDEPEGGIFSEYRVYWKQSTSFSFTVATGATAEANGYFSATVPKSSDQYTIPFLGGGDYTVGVLTNLPLGVNYFSSTSPSAYQTINVGPGPGGDCN